MPRTGLRWLQRAAAAGMLAVLAACGSMSGSNSAYYRVKEGDTLYQIARDQDQSVDDLVRWNRLRNPSQISAGMLLRVKPPYADASTKSRSSSSASSGGKSGAQARKPQQQAAAKPRASAALRNISLVWPAEGKVTKGFNGSFSRGLTIANREGTPVVAAASGTVAYSSNGLRGYGNLVILRHAGDVMTIYAHNRKLLVKEGERVTQGQRIAEMGRSDAAQPGLYFEVRQDGQPVNPMGALPPR